MLHFEIVEKMALFVKLSGNFPPENFVVVEDNKLHNDREVKSPKNVIKQIELMVTSERQRAVVHLCVVSQLINVIQFSVFHLVIKHHLKAYTQSYITVLSPHFLEVKPTQRYLNRLVESIYEPLLLEILFLFDSNPVVNILHQLNLMNLQIVLNFFSL